MGDKLYMKDAKTIIMSCFSAEQRDEDRQRRRSGRLESAKISSTENSLESSAGSRSGGITVHYHDIMEATQSKLSSG